ncbi:MAG: hypothetical protein U0527_17905 [Candidatus Eisenbacteria bacterium]
MSGADDDWLARHLRDEGRRFRRGAGCTDVFFDLSLVDHAHLLAFLCHRRGREEITTDDAYQRAA